ncbi:MAG: phosphatidate cytidylyltransferase [Victivallales bacterium]|nr:phosphatidate cytidylyltransferase [Victivallales bacterium]
MMLKYRLPTGITIGMLILGSIFLREEYAVWLFIAVGGTLAYLATDELLGIIEKTGMPSFRLHTSTLAAIILVLKVLDMPEILSLAILFLMVIASWLSIMIAKDKKKTVAKIAGSFLALPLLVVPLYALASIYSFNDGAVDGRMYFFYLILVTKLGDVGAYSAGMASARMMSGGNHKILPQISPKKSWEGTLGGLVASIAASLVFCQYVPGIASGSTNTHIAAIVLGALLFAGGFAGDLGESALKRAAGVKDSGTSLPGMGGVLDVLDSLVINSPMFYLFIVLTF